jgi:hypothetical protein
MTRHQSFRGAQAAGAGLVRFARIHRNEEAARGRGAVSRLRRWRTASDGEGA